MFRKSTDHFNYKLLEDKESIHDNKSLKVSDTLLEIKIDSFDPGEKNQSKYLNRELIVYAKEIIANIDETLKIFDESHCTPAFALTSLVTLSSTAGWIAMTIAADRFDVSFLAAASGGMASLLAFVIMIAAWLKDCRWGFLSTFAVATFEGFLQAKLYAYYGSSPLLAEGAGATFLLGWISYILNCACYAEAKRTEVSIVEQEKISSTLSQINATPFMFADKKNPENYIQMILPNLIATKDELLKAIKDSSLLRNNIFNTLSTKLPSDIQETVLDYACDNPVLLKFRK